MTINTFIFLSQESQYSEKVTKLQQWDSYEMTPVIHPNSTAYIRPAGLSII